jgi:TRAP-type C4-dicarboxylate transport system substrate-binding protein
MPLMPLPEAARCRRDAMRRRLAAWAWEALVQTGAVIIALVGLLSGVPAARAQAPASPTPELTLRIVGGLAVINQYTRHEEPFWAERLPRLSGGRWRADIVPFDRAGLRAAELLTMVHQGSAPFANVLLALGTPKDPELMAVDLPGLNPDLSTLRRSVAAFRPTLEQLLRERYGIELLALYLYPAQVVYCRQAFTGLADLKGRRVRTSSRAQSDWVEALGGTAVVTPFAELMGNMRAGNIDCAITGTMSGWTIGLHEVATHVHTMAVSWGLSAFVVNGTSWRALPADLRALLQRELPRLEREIWEESERETTQGLACLIGAAGCPMDKRGQMTEVRTSEADQKLRATVFAGTVLPRWVQRCGPQCPALWNGTLGVTSGVRLPAPAR